MSDFHAHAACQCTSLAENEVGAVALCPQCGVVTLRLQYISLRFEAEAFERVASLVLQAQARLGHVPPFRPLVGDRADGADLRGDEAAFKPH